MHWLWHHWWNYIIIASCRQERSKKRRIHGCIAAFIGLDNDNNGRLSKEELNKLWERELTIEINDKDGEPMQNGELLFVEFVEFIDQVHKKHNT